MNFIALYSVCVSYYIRLTASTKTTNASRVLTKFGPLFLTYYENVGSQEVLFVQIPSSYESKFAFEWTFGIATSDGSSADACPESHATVLLREFGIPVPNPRNSSFPEQIMITNYEIHQERFPITKKKPYMDKFVIHLEDTSIFMGEYYLSVFMFQKNQEPEKIPKQCNYIAELTVTVNGEISLTEAVVQSKYKLQSLIPANVAVNHTLERHRNGLLSTRYETAKEGYIVSSGTSLRFGWIVLPYEDVGGTLRVSIGFIGNDSQITSSSIIKACITWDPSCEMSWNDCKSGNAIAVDGSKTPKNTWYWQYPKSGIWVLDLGIDCVRQPCVDFANISVDVDITRCVQSCHSQYSQGQCKIYQTDVLVFSACDCMGGWAGIACTDGTNAVSREKQLLMTLMLTLSNLIFLACGVLAVIKHYFVESIVYFFVLFFSTFYHACDNDFAIAFCLAPYNTLQFSDFYGSVVAVWITLIAIAKLPFRIESAFHCTGIMVIAVAVTYDRFSVLTTLIPVLVGLSIIIFKWGRECTKVHHCFPTKQVWMFSLIPGSLCGVIGFVLFVFVETNSNYYYVHSLWHVLMGSAVMFFIPKEKKFSWLKSDQYSSSRIGTHSITGLYYNSDACENGIDCDFDIAISSSGMS